MTSKNNENSIDSANYETIKHNFAIKKCMSNHDNQSIQYTTNSFQTPQVNKISNKPIKDQFFSINSTSCPLKKIVLKPNHSQANSNTSNQSYFQGKIVQLQQQLLQTKKQSTLKQSSWVKEKNILMSKIQILNFENAQTKMRNNNLNQINQRLAEVLSQTNKKSDGSLTSTSQQMQNQRLKSSISEKQKTIKDLQGKIQDFNKKQNEISKKYDEECQLHSRNRAILEEYKKLMKQKNQRKVEAEQNMLNFMQNINILKQKIISLPVKESYLRPIISFIKNFEDVSMNQMQMSVESLNQVNNYPNELNSSSTPSYMSSKPLYQQNSSYLLNGGKQQSKAGRNNFVKQNQYFSHRNSNDYQLEHEEPFSIGYESSEVQEYQDNSNYWKKNKYQQQQEAIYQCEKCQNCFTKQNFIKHMKQCETVSELLKQKNLIQSRLISIQQNKHSQRTASKRVSNNKSRIQLSQILNMSNISNNKSNCKKSSRKTNQIQRSRKNSYIKKHQNQVQKQSMQDQIRKIVQALNEAGNNSHRSNLSKHTKLGQKSRNQSQSYLLKDKCYIRNQQSRYDDFY